MSKNNVPVVVIGRVNVYVSVVIELKIHFQFFDKNFAARANSHIQKPLRAAAVDFSLITYFITYIVHVIYFVQE